MDNPNSEFFQIASAELLEAPENLLPRTIHHGSFLILDLKGMMGRIQAIEIIAKLHHSVKPQNLLLFIHVH